MKRFVLCLAVVVLALIGCKKENGPQSGAQTLSNEDTPSVNADSPATAGGRYRDFSFDEIFSIFSLFGDNIMTDKFAAQSVKDSIRTELMENYADAASNGGYAYNTLSYTLFGGDCYDGFEMGCWGYDADDHVLVLLSEGGGCDGWATKYVRAYEYDPAAKNAHEVALPLNPYPDADAFEDLLRLAGCGDIPYIREMMRDRVYNYDFTANGLKIFLNTFDDWQVADKCGFELFYRWNGSEFVRDDTVPYPCIHPEGFAMILLGEKMPGTNFDYDPLDYDIRYSEEGGLWLIDREGKRVMEVQLDGEEVGSIEVFDPRYSVQHFFYPQGEGVLAVGCRINDYFDFTEDDAPEVQLFNDGTVAINPKREGTRLSFRTTKDDLAVKTPAMKATEMVVTLKDPQFKPEATVKSILIQRAE